MSSLLRRGGLKNTMFTEWFELNKRDPQARTLTYAEIPGKYVCNDVAKTWTPRKQRKCVGRILYCHPTAGERYFLRLLLTIIRGPDSYEAIRTLNNITYATFKEACYAHGLLNDDKEWTDAILEASTWATGPQLRELFVTILLMCEVSNIQQLWERCWEALSDDILIRKRKHFSFHELQLSNEQLQNYCLVDIEELLHRAGKSLIDYEGLPKPDPILLTQIDNRLIREELKYNVSQLQREHDCLFSQLNPEQLAIYTNVVKSIQEDTGGFFFVYGPGGTGKTFLYKTILSKIRSSGIIALAVASSGIASLLLPGGRTAHSRFVIPLEVMENSTCGIKQNTQLAKLMQEVKLIVWDEAPMTKRHAFEALDKTLRDILGLHNSKNRERVFGGMTILLGGDFRQVLPVIEKGKRQEIVQACINKSDLWKYCKLFSLTRSMRVNEIDDTGNIDISKQTFNRWILEVGDGIAPAMAKESDDEPTWIHIPDQHLIKQSSDPITQIIDEIYPSFLNHREDEDYLRERAILTPKNSDADEINSFMFNMLAGESKTYKSFDELCKASTDNDELDNQYPTEFLNTLTFPGMPPHSLQLKEGLPVMLLRNVNPAEGLCNGTRLIITFMGRFVIKARIITGSKIGNTALIPRIFLTSTRSKWPFIMKRRQFPIKPCYAMTINKSQGQSLNYVGIYLPNPVFTHGQLYVAISRVTNPEGLKILMLNDATVNFENRTRNIVYKEVFNNLLCNEENATSSSP